MPRFRVNVNGTIHEGNHRRPSDAVIAAMRKWEAEVMRAFENEHATPDGPGYPGSGKEWARRNGYWKSADFTELAILVERIPTTANNIADRHERAKHRAEKRSYATWRSQVPCLPGDDGTAK